MFKQMVNFLVTWLIIILLENKHLYFLNHHGDCKTSGAKGTLVLLNVVLKCCKVSDLQEMYIFCYSNFYEENMETIKHAEEISSLLPISTSDLPPT
jgi:hypothetical protein